MRRLIYQITFAEQSNFDFGILPGKRAEILYKLPFMKKPLGSSLK
jgi:hypothetical protein